MKKILGAVAALLVVGVLGCQGNDSIPKLVPLEQFDGDPRLESLGDAVVFAQPKIDILFVIDDSGSMGSFQASLSENIDIFLEELQSIDQLSYRVAVVTSGARSPALQAVSQLVSSSTLALGGFIKGHVNEPDYITNSTRDGLLLLKERLTPGISGSGHEVFFETALNALTDPHQAEFVRSDAHLAVIFLTDGEDVSETVTWVQLAQGLVEIKKDASKVLAYGALIPSSYSSQELTALNCRRDDQGPPVNIERLIEEFNGEAFDICGGDFGQGLAQIGRNLGRALGQYFVLADVPDPSTIEVFAGDFQIPNDPRAGWVYLPERNEIVFGKDLVLDEAYADTQISVRYNKATHFRK